MSLMGYIHDIKENVARLHQEIDDLQQQNQDLKDMLAHTHQRWWCSKKDAKIDELVKDFMKTGVEVEQLIQSSNVEDFLKHGR